MKNLRASFSVFRFFIFAPLCAVVLVSLFSSFTAAAQDLPKEIRGYKVYRAEVSVKNESGEIKNKSDAFVKVGEPKIVDISLTGVTVEIPAEFVTSGQSGKIDFLSFKDFRLNNLPITVEEYKESLTFTKNQTIALPKPIKVFIGTSSLLRGSAKEINNAGDEWTVTGTVFIFGRFKKFGFHFKRVIPVEINLKIKNPIKSE